MGADAVLRVAGIHKRFGGVQALRGVSLTVAPGERRAVIGPNGAGKSTLFRIISGEMRPSAGDVYFRSRNITGFCPEGTAALGLSRTFQHSSLFGHLTVEENAALAVVAHRRGRWSPVRPLACFRRELEQAREALAAVGLSEKAAMPASRLSHGERRQLEIAMALAQGPALLLLDEPAAGLAGAERARLLRLLRQLPRDVTVLLIEHDLDFAFDLADTATVLHMGEVIGEGSPERVREDPRVEAVYIGRPPAAPGSGRPSGAPPGEPVLEAEGVRAGYGDAAVIDGVSLHVRRGELVALLGRNGMGKTTLLHALAGFLRPRAGRIAVEGRDVTGRTPLELARAAVALVPQGRRLFPDLTVEEQLLLGARPGRWSLERVWDLFPRLRERRSLLATRLSGGEQQMLAIARALLRNPRVLVLDEPSEGLSPLLVRTLMDVLGTLRDEGETILLAEQNAAMALSVADRAYVLERGRIVHEDDAPSMARKPVLLRRLLGV